MYSKSDEKIKRMSNPKIDRFKYDIEEECIEFPIIYSSQAKDIKSKQKMLTNKKQSKK